MSRERAVEIIKGKYGAFLESYLSDFPENFDMNEYEYWTVIDSFVNMDILEKVSGRQELKFPIIKILEKGKKFSFY